MVENAGMEPSAASRELRHSSLMHSSFMLVFATASPARKRRGAAKEPDPRPRAMVLGRLGERAGRMREPASPAPRASWRGRPSHAPRTQSRPRLTSSTPLSRRRPREDRRETGARRTPGRSPRGRQRRPSRRIWARGPGCRRVVGTCGATVNMQTREAMQVLAVCLYHK